MVATPKSFENVDNASHEPLQLSKNSMHTINAPPFPILPLAKTMPPLYKGVASLVTVFEATSIATETKVLYGQLHHSITHAPQMPMTIV